MSYSEHSLGEFYLSAEMQSMYSAVPADWARFKVDLYLNFKDAYVCNRWQPIEWQKVVLVCLLKLGTIFWERDDILDARSKENVACFNIFSSQKKKNLGIIHKVKNILFLQQI